MEDQTQGGQGQNPRDFTVQIRDSRAQPIGTGCIVSSDGKIVTCAHVVRDALGVEPCHASDRQITVYFPPRTINDIGEERHAVVSAYSPKYKDDVVLLQLVDGSLPLPSSRVAVLGSAEASFGHPFRSYGFRPFNSPSLSDLRPSLFHDFGWTDGEIQGTVPAKGQQLLAEPIQICASGIRGGMSGAPVLDKTDRNLVIGIISTTYYSETAKDRDIAWAVNAGVLALEPFHLPVRETPLPLRAIPFLLSRDAISTIRTAIKMKPGQELNGAPLPLPEWVGRSSMLQSLSKDWANQQCKLTGIVGIGGEGKSSLVRHWLEVLCNDISQPQPDGIFWWNFDEIPNVDRFFNAALEYFLDYSKALTGISKEEINNVPEQFLAAMLGAGRYLFILDGLEEMQQEEGDHYGLLKDERLTKFLSYFATLAHQSHCVITSRAPLIDLAAYATYTQHILDPLNIDEGLALLRHLGIKGNDIAVTEIVKKWGGYALVLNLLGKLLKENYAGNIAATDEISLLPSHDDSPEGRVHKILNYYGHVLTTPEHALLILCSAFRATVPHNALVSILHAAAQSDNVLPAQLNESNLDQLISHLLAYAILRKNEQGEYMFHSLLHAYYIKQFTAQPAQTINKLYAMVAEYYRGIARYYQHESDEAFSSMGVKTNFSPSKVPPVVLYKASQLGSQWAKSWTQSGDWRTKMLGMALGYAAGYAVGATVGLLTDAEVWRSSAESIKHFLQGRKSKQKEQYNEKEADYYQGLADRARNTRV